MKTNYNPIAKLKTGAADALPSQQTLAFKPLTQAVLTALMALTAIAAQPVFAEDKQDKNDGMTTEARGRMSDSSSKDKRATEINFVDTLPRSGERRFALPCSGTAAGSAARRGGSCWHWQESLALIPGA